MNASQLLVVLPYCQKDVEDAKRLLAWIGKLSPKLSPHCCVLAGDAVVPHETKRELQSMAKAIFYYAETAIIPVSESESGWPKASNAMFRIASAHARECFRLPWLWLEPDCVPLVPSWLDQLAVHYNQCPKKFMGNIIKSNQANMPSAHVAGCAIYPTDAGTTLAEHTKGAMAWDIAAAQFMVPRTYDCGLIHHHYGTMALPPTFKETKEPGDPANTCTRDFIRKEAVLFHRVKDATLIDLLSKSLHSKPTNTPAAEIPAALTETRVKRGPGRPRKSEPAPATSTA